MRKVKYLGIAISIAIVTAEAFAGPFGIDMGMTLDEITKLSTTAPVLSEGVYIITPPKPHPMFETYVVRISKTYGVYFIKAVGKTIETSIYGDTLKGEFQTLKDGLVKTYGSCNIMDFLRSGSIWDEPDDWMMGLRKGERFLMATWGSEYGSTLPEDIASIIIAAQAISSQAGYLGVEYYSPEYEKAK